MPELPEVETIVREMRGLGLVGLKIERVSIFWDRTIANQNPSEFCQQLISQTIQDIYRRGKFIVFTLSHDLLLVHLRMTGKFIIDKVNSPPSSHERVRLHLNDGHILHYEDQRKFGKWYLANSAGLLKKIGLEPLSTDFTLKAFKHLIDKRKRQIKPFLLDQHFIAGIGNIYADEALWMAKIHPARTAETLTDKEIAALHKAVICVLQLGVDNTGTSLGAARANYYSVSGRRGKNQEVLKVFRCNGLPCPRCQTIIQKFVLAQRGTHFCPNCQKQ